MRLLVHLATASIPLLQVQGKRILKGELKMTVLLHIPLALYHFREVNYQLLTKKYHHAILIHGPVVAT